MEKQQCCVEKNGWTPLHYAACQNHLKCMEFFISLGEENGGSAHIDKKSINGWTPLHYAAINGNLECMEFLISNGSNINEKNNSGMTPFDLMIEGDKIKIKEYMKKMEEDPLIVKGVVEDE